MRTVVAVLAVCLATEASAHIPSRCASLTEQLEAGAIGKTRTMQGLQTAAEREDLMDVLYTVNDMVNEDREFSR